MACRPCQERRNRAAAALKNKNYSQAAREVVSGAAAMAGIIPKDAMPGKSGRRN